MYKSYSFLLLLALFITQLTSCAAPAVVGGPVAYADRRNAEVIYTDQKLEFKSILETQDINEEDNLSFVSFNQVVLITGEVPTEKVKKEIESTIRKISGVKDVKNYLTIGMKSSLKSQASDIAITSNVISRLFVKEHKSQLSPLHVKVYTEKQTVYLMGLLNNKEAEDAVKITKSSKGVKKVIPLFEIDDKYSNSY